MWFAEPARRTLIVLAADEAPPSPPETWALSLADLVAASDAHCAVELFCGIEPAEVPAPTGRRLRCHARESDLGRALRLLEAAGPAEPACDVTWAVVGLRAPKGWDEALHQALQAHAALGTVSPLCPEDPLYTPHGPGTASRHGDEELHRRLHAIDVPAVLQMPAPMRWAGAVRAAVATRLRQAAALSGASSPMDWGGRVGAMGLAHGACTRVAVHAPAAARAPEVGAMGTTLLGLHGLGDAHPLHALRWWMSQQDLPLAAAEHLPESPEGPRPTRLHLSHGWGGGLEAWVRDFCAADTAHDSLILRPVGTFGAFAQQLVLLRSHDPGAPIRAWSLAQPIHATAPAHLEYRTILAEIIEEFGVQSLLVSSLIGHSLDALRTRLPTVLVAHDHLPFCVAIYAYFGSECRSCDHQRLAHCIQENPGHRFFRGVTSQDWVVLREAFIETVRTQDIAIAAPSRSTAKRWQSLMPELGVDRFRVIPHGIDLPEPPAFEARPDERLRLVMIGRISQEKGAAILQQALPQLLQRAELTLIGCGDAGQAWAGHVGVTVIPGFRRDELPGLIAEARPHLGLLLSTVPETFSYALSELWHCGVPVLASRLGALADRISEADNGFLCEPTSASLLARLEELDSRREELSALSRRLRKMPQRSCRAMVADHEALLSTRPRPPYPVFAARGMRRSGTLSLAPSSVTRMAVGVMHIDPTASWLQAWRSFVRYTLVKAARSSRLPLWVRQWVQRWRAGRHAHRQGGS